MIGIICLLLIFVVWGSLLVDMAHYEFYRKPRYEEVKKDWDKIFELIESLPLEEECADMYEIKNPDPIQNEKCYGCEFYNWDAERKEYICGIKCCYENSKFVEFDWNKMK